jgi:hypothetical protein
VTLPWGKANRPCRPIYHHRLSSNYARGVGCLPACLAPALDVVLMPRFLGVKLLSL